MWRSDLKQLITEHDTLLQHYVPKNKPKKQAHRMHVHSCLLQLHARFVRFRKRLSRKDTTMGMLERMGYPLLLAVSIFTAVMTFPSFLGPYMAMDDISISNSLFG